MHAYTSLLAHIVFATQGRRLSITADLNVKLLPYIAGIIRNLGGHALRINAVEDHLHLLARTLHSHIWIVALPKGTQAWSG